MIGSEAPRRAVVPAPAGFPPLLPWVIVAVLAGVMLGLGRWAPDSAVGRLVGGVERGAVELGARDRHIVDAIDEVQARRVQSSRVLMFLGTSKTLAALPGPNALEAQLTRRWRGTQATPAPDLLVAHLHSPGLHLGLIPGALQAILDAAPQVLAIEVDALAPAGHPRLSLEGAGMVTPRVLLAKRQVPRPQALAALRARWEGAAMLPEQDCQVPALAFLREVRARGTRVVLLEIPVGVSALDVVPAELLARTRADAVSLVARAGFQDAPLVTLDRPVPDAQTYDLRHLNDKGRARYTRAALPVLFDALAQTEAP